MATYVRTPHTGVMRMWALPCCLRWLSKRYPARGVGVVDVGWHRRDAGLVWCMWCRPGVVQGLLLVQQGAQAGGQGADPVDRAHSTYSELRYSSLSRAAV